MPRGPYKARLARCAGCHDQVVRPATGLPLCPDCRVLPPAWMVAPSHFVAEQLGEARHG